MKILIVDDNLSLAQILKMTLEEERHEVRLARDGIDGYMTYLLFLPDLVITDIQMPERNGLELMKLIRNHDPNARAIYISADLDQFGPLLEKEMTTHLVTCLQKPFSKNELMHSLVQLSSERKTKPEIKQPIRASW
jgi:YesN/AraC family two-component response regulator